MNLKKILKKEKKNPTSPCARAKHFLDIYPREFILCGSC